MPTVASLSAFLSARRLRASFFGAWGPTPRLGVHALRSRRLRAVGPQALFFVLSSFFILHPSSFLFAQPPPPALTAPVNDFANVIDEQSEREMDRQIRALQAATGDTVAVATVRTFKPYATIDEFAREMFENGGRGIGQKGKDNGVLIVAAIDDRALRIEVGYDLEEFITDGFAGEIIRQVILPDFRTGNYGRGLLAGVTRIVNRVAERRGVTLQGVPRPRETPSRARGQTKFVGVFGPLLLWFIVLALTNRGRRRRRRRWGGGPWSGWSSGVGPFGGGSFGGGFGGFGGGGGGGGGFGGFGGGRSGGGGASGGW